MGEAPLLHVPLVIGTGAVEALIVTTVTFPEPIQEILELRKTIWIDHCDTTLANVLVQGRLHICYIVVGAAPTASGDARPLLAVPTWTGFVLRIPVAGAEPDCDAVPVDGHATADASRVTGVDQAGRIVTVCDRTLARVSVKVTRAAAVPVTAHLPAPSPAPALPATPPKGFTISRFGGRGR